MDELTIQAIEIVKIQASIREMTEEEINTMIDSVSKHIKKIINQSAEEFNTDSIVPPVDPKKAIREKSIVCLECGKSFKMITKKHLAKHNLAAEDYKKKWGYNKNISLSCKSLSRDRRKRIKNMEIWKLKKGNK